MEQDRILSRKFTHLHVHTEYSFLDGACRTRDLPSRIKELGMDSVAITDHGSMFGIIEFYNRCIENGIKPIIGCEVYTAARTRFDKDAGVDAEQGHLVLLARDQVGYRNLVRLVSAGYTEGFYYKPRVDMELLKRYPEGLIALSACLSGDIPGLLLAGKYDEAKKLALHFREIYGERRFYLEMQANRLKEQSLVNNALIRMSKETNIPLVATNDAHYLRREDAHMHDILLCIQTASNLNDPDRMRFPSDDFYIRSPEEMEEFFRDFPEALDNTKVIADECNLEIEFGRLRLPKFKMPAGHENEDHLVYLTKLSNDGLIKRYGVNPPESAIERLKYELGIISGMGYVDYYLIVWDFIRYAIEKGIPVGPGRGSGAASIVAYSIGITDIDPIKYNLIFERFLNPERISMPDFDIDFCDRRRQEVIDYVINKYGADCVSQIGTFSFLKARSAIRDVGRVMAIPIPEVDKIAKMMNNLDISKALEQNPELKNACENDPVCKEIVETAIMLEGMPRQSGVHAAGVVISDQPLASLLPVILNKEGAMTTQFPMGQIEALGFLKMDFLGLRTLTVIHDSVEMIKSKYGIEIDINNIPYDDMKVYEGIGDGKTVGIFQLESPGMTRFMKDLKPSSLEDIIAGISLFRPGPMEQIPRYVEGKNNPDMVTYLHPLLEPILKVTYGCLVYQEQVMQTFRDLGGYSMGRSDLVRKAMSKKQSDVMEKERHNFIYGIIGSEGRIEAEGALRRGVSEDIANQLFDQIMDFASYAFNKAHAAAYAVVAYRTAWLKTYYPEELMAATMNSYSGDIGKLSFYINECRNMGIEVLPPDINESFSEFTVTEKAIRFGLAAVKNVGEAAVAVIIAERTAGGLYKGFPNFCMRTVGVGVNKKSIENLVKCGAFDSLGVERSRMLAVLEVLTDSIASSKSRNSANQISLMDLYGNQVAGLDLENIDVEYPTLDEFPREMLCGFEKELLGVYITGHPVSIYAKLLEHKTNLNSRDISEWVAVNMSSESIDEQLGMVDGEEGEPISGSGTFSDLSDNVLEVVRDLRDGAEVLVGGMISGRRNRITKAKKMMATFMVEDIYGQIEVVVFPAAYERCSSQIQAGSIAIIRGKLMVRLDEIPKVACNEILQLDLAEKSTLKISLPTGAADPQLSWILPYINYFSGDTKVCIFNKKDNSEFYLDDRYKLDATSDFVTAEIRRRVESAGGEVTFV